MGRILFFQRVIHKRQHYTELHLLTLDNFPNVLALVDFDGSSFGATNLDRVSVIGTRGWISLELNRRDRITSLSEAFKAELYSFEKLCAWILVHGILGIGQYTREPSRASPQRHESFDLRGAINRAESLNGNDLQTFFKPADITTCLSLSGFFATTFVGLPDCRSEDIYALMRILERTMI